MTARALVATALVATAAAVLAREAGWTGLAAIGLLWFAVIRWSGCRRVGWWLALPTALAALPGPVAPWQYGDGPVRVRGRVASVERWDPLEQTGSVRVESGGETVRCVFTDPIDLVRGDHVALAGRMRGSTVQVAPGTIRHRAASDPAAALARGRGALQRRIDAALPGEAGPLIASLVFGRGPTVDADLARAHRNTGLSHLLAVSGAHVAMIAWLLGQAFGGGWPMHRRGFRRLCAALLIAYGGVTGLEAPVFRAVAGFLVGIWLGGHRRPLGLAAALAVPACLTCAVDPRGLFGVSFCLSYSAVLGLSLAGPWGGDGWQRWLWTPLRASFWAMVTTTPWTCWYFSQWAPATLIGTPLLAPLVAPLLGGGLAVSVVGGDAPVVGPLLCWLLEHGTTAYAESVRLLDEAPGTPVLATYRPDLAIVLLCGGLGLALTARFGLRARVLGACLGMSLPHFASGDGSDLPAAQLVDVGHGLACVLRVDESTVVVDCGSIPVARRAAEAVARALGRRRVVDRLILTHADSDHVGGVADLVTRVHVREVLAAQRLEHHPAVRAAVEAGARWRPLPANRTLDLGGLSIWAPPASFEGNDASVWIEARTAAGTVLLTGDAERRGVLAALRHAGFGKADVLLLPHHGRQCGLGSLLDMTDPAAALVSGPVQDAAAVPEVLARGVPVFCTGSCGTIRWTVSGGDRRLEGEGAIAAWKPERRP